jgi:serine/threonine protein kinase
LNEQTAKIGDFGLAVVAEQHAEAHNEIWGTPYYVAPERLNNEPEDFRSDIYSLGATLFHAIAGRPPIEGETTSASELRRLKSNPPDLRAVAPDVSREAARIINQMLAPNPANRFASYAELIDQLERIGVRPGARGGSRRLLAIGAAVVTLAALLGAGFYLVQKKKTAIAPVASATPAQSSPSSRP